VLAASETSLRDNAEDGLICCEISQARKYPNDLESESAPSFYHLKPPQRSWRLPKGKPALELPRAISRCPEKQQLPGMAAPAAPRSHSSSWVGRGQGRRAGLRAPQGLATTHAQPVRSAPLPALRSSMVAGAGRSPGTLAERGLSARVFKLFHLQKRDGENSFEST